METLWRWDVQGLEAINRSLHSPVLNPVFWVFTSLGLGWVQVLLILPLFAFERLRITALGGLAALAVSGALVHLCKWQFPRLRPSNLSQTLVAPDERIFYSSFPSGHATTAFAVATALTILWPGRRWLVGSVLFAVAVAVAVSRVYRGVHWPTDVIAGALLGFASGVIISYFFARKEN